MKIKSLIALRTQTFTIPYRCLNGHVSSLLELATANSVLLLSLGLFILCQTAAASALGLERITRADLKPLVQGMPGEQAFRKRIVVATNVTMSAELEVTAKGNGYLRIGNLNLKVFDSHDDGTYFEKDLLTIDFADIDGDGKRELIICGVVCYSDDRAETVVRREAIVFIFALQADQTFKEVYRNTEFRLN